MFFSSSFFRVLLTPFLFLIISVLPVQVFLIIKSPFSHVIIVSEPIGFLNDDLIFDLKLLSKLISASASISILFNPFSRLTLLNSKFL